MSVNRQDYSDELVEGGFAIEVADAPLLHEGLNLADLAHVLVLQEGGIAPAPAVARLLGVLLDAQATPVGEFGYDPAYGETYNWRERRFTEGIGDDAGWLHAGRTRREAVRVALRIRLRRDVVDLIEAAARFVEAAAELAGKHAETYMADQTYLQHAQPSTFGHYLLQFAYSGLRDVDRLVTDLAWINRSPGGVGCVNGSSLPYDRARIAELLGFDDVIEHTRDAMWQADGLLTLVADAAGLVTTLAKLAEDLEIWSSKEFDYVELAHGHTRGSVMMPQKRNPYALSMVRGEAGVLIGRLTGLYAVAKTPSARSDNLIFAYGEVPRSTELATKATRLMAGVVGGLRVNAAAMYRALETGYSQSTDLAEFVMLAAEVDYRTAYDVVGVTVRRAAREGVAGIAITGEMLDAAATEVRGHPLGLTGRDLTAVLDPASIVRTRATRGGAAPEVVRGMADDCLAAARGALAAAQARRAAFAQAEEKLLVAAADRAGAEWAGGDWHRRAVVEG
ncbi:MAG: argininosuccinate lyase [Pseudonocardia sp.]